MTTPSHSSSYLHSLVGWLHRLLAWQIAVTRHSYGALADDAYRGLYVPDAEVDILGMGEPALPDELVLRRQELADERAALAAHGEALRQSEDAPAFVRVAQLFGLSPFEQDVLLLAFAPALDLRYERLYAYLQDDVSKKRPSVDLAFRLFCPDPAAQRAARAAFAADSPLLRFGLVQLLEDGQRQPPLLAQFLRIDERIVSELLDSGQPTIDPVLLPYAAYERPQRSLRDLVLSAELRDRLEQIGFDHEAGLVVALQGSYGSGRRAIAEALCASTDQPLLSIDLHRLLAHEPNAPPTLAPAEAVRRIVREGMLHHATILWTGADRLLHEDDAGPWHGALLAALDTYPGRSVLALERPWEARTRLRHARYVRVVLPTPSFGEREQIWAARLQGDLPDPATLAALASTFRLSGGQIRDAVAMARSLAQWERRPLAPPDLYAACRAQSSGRLATLARKITTTYTWADIVLPVEQVSQLREVCIQVRHRRTVLDGWGFDKHLAMGKGVNVLFAGQSGTGKTMAAEIIAADLGLELYKVDLSTMVSKYIGETEKNLDQVFTAAREANAIVFFDEADAIFGKRSEVKDAHDRYANIEVGYLLQKMEEYDGVVILATNLRKNLDDAFVRRLHVAIDFPFPEEADRLRIWQTVFPPEAPLADDVRLAVVAKHFKLAGGNIRTIALLAAYFAAEEGSVISMAHIVRAIKREYQKLGRLVTEAEFGAWLPTRGA